MTVVAADTDADILVSDEPMSRRKEARGAFIPYALIGIKVGRGVAKAVMTAAVSSRTPEALGSAVMSATTVRGHVQAELVHLIAVRVSMHSPQHLRWLLQIVTEYCATLSPGTTVTTLATRTLRYHVAAFGLQGIIASAAASAAVGALCSTCSLVTSNAAFWRAESKKMSLRQYRYDLATSVYAGLGTIAGSGLGALVGSAIMPGFGTVFGSVSLSVGGNYLVTHYRKGNGPDDRRRRYLREVAAFEPLQTESFCLTDPETGDVIEGTLILEAGEMKSVKKQKDGQGAVPTAAKASAVPVAPDDDGEDVDVDVDADGDGEAPAAPLDPASLDSTVLLTRRHRTNSLAVSSQSNDAVGDETSLREVGLVPSRLSFHATGGADEASAKAAATADCAPKVSMWQRVFGRAKQTTTESPSSHSPCTATAADLHSSSSPLCAPASPSEQLRSRLGDGVGPTGCEFAGQVVAFDEMHSWEEVDRAVEECGAEEMVLVFAARHDGKPLEMS